MTKKANKKLKEIAASGTDCAHLHGDHAVPDPTLRISNLATVQKAPLSVKPDQPLDVAVTLMLLHNYSQLPVMCGRKVKGVISWKSIACRKVMAPGGCFVRDFMDKTEIEKVSHSEPLLSAVRRIAVRDYVLVQAADETIANIVTAADIVDQFLSLAEPFLLLEEIEKGIRHLLDGKIPEFELAEAKAPGDDPRTVTPIQNLTLGEYCRLIDNPVQWCRLGVQLDRTSFVQGLHKVIRIRNKTMHFSHEKATTSEMDELSEFARLLRQIREFDEAR